MSSHTNHQLSLERSLEERWIWISCPLHGDACKVCSKIFQVGSYIQGTGPEEKYPVRDMPVNVANT